MPEDVLSIVRPSLSLNDQVVVAVRDAIAAGTLKPGQRLTERELMERTGVGRTSIREALNQLRTMGLAEERRGGGLMVAVLDAQTIEHIYDVRAAIEPMVAELFTIRATDVEVDQLLEESGFLLDAANGPDSSSRAEFPATYEKLLFEGARNPLLREIIEPINVRIQRIRQLSLTMEGRYEASLAEERGILDAVRRREPEEAARLTRAHIATAKASALAALERVTQA